MEKCQVIASTPPSGVQQRASKRRCWEPCFGMHYLSDSANILYFRHKIRTGVRESIWF